MKNDVFTELGANPEIFFQKMNDYLSNNIDSILCRSVANLLSLDYVTRLNFSPELNAYVNICIKRLQKYLGARVILDNSLTETMELFTIAITPENEGSDKSIKSQEQLIDTMIESIITESFSDLSPQEKITMRLSIKEIIHSKNRKELLSMIHSDYGLFKELIINTLKNRAPEKEAVATIITHLQNLSQQAQALKTKKINIKNFAGKIAISVGLLATASLGFVFSGLVLPAIIIPTAIVSIKAASNIGEKIANKAIIENSDVQNNSLSLKRAKLETIEITSQSPVIGKDIKKQQNVDLTKELQKQGTDISKAIKNSLSIENTPKNSFEEKSKQEKQGQSQERNR
jgi:hypothetical protein